MTMPLEKLIQETLGDVDNLSQEKIQELIQEAFKTFAALKEKSHSTDPKEREEAYKMAMSLKDSIQTQTEEFSKASGIDPAMLANMSDNQDLFTAEVWQELSAAKNELEALRVDLSLKKKKDSSPVKKNKTVRLPV